MRKTRCQDLGQGLDRLLGTALPQAGGLSAAGFINAVVRNRLYVTANTFVSPQLL